MEESLSPTPAPTAEPADQDEKFWKEHIAAAQSFKGSAREYCRQNGINQRKFRSYRRLFGYTKLRKSPQKAFIRIETSSQEPSIHKAMNKKESILPDPKWVAGLIAALMEHI